jgi:hypothetical protein
MLVVYLMFYVVALVLFALAALGIGASRFNLMAGGLFFVTLVSTLMVFQKL